VWWAPSTAWKKVSAIAAIDVAAKIRRHADGIAAEFVELFLDEFWRPFDEAGQPAERWPEVFDALERLRPLAVESLVAIFQIAMTERVEQELGEQIARLTSDDGDPGRDAA